MRRRKKEEKAINTIPTFINYQFYKNTSEPNNALVKKANNKIEFKNLYEGREELDMFSFMGNFDFPDLEELKNSLTKSGKYKKLEIEEIIAGLKTLPEYRD